MMIAFIFCTNSCSQTQDSNQSLDSNTAEVDSIPTFLMYGELSPIGYVEPRDSLTTKKFGFKVRRVAGCEVTSLLSNKVEKHNIESNQKMIRKFGKEWKQKFEDQSNLKLAIQGL